MIIFFFLALFSILIYLISDIFDLYILLFWFFFYGFKFRFIYDFLCKLFLFFYYKLKDKRQEIEDMRNGVVKFKPFGLTLFAGRQGSGKTVSLVDYTMALKKKYPDSLLYTNYKCDFADGQLNSLNDILTIRNGEKGVVFAIDELQNEFSSAISKDFPETLLSTITQQRKQKIHIVATSQVFTRCSKPLREQTFKVVDCRTLFGRWTFQKCYDADDYNLFVDNPDPEKKFKLMPLWKKSFIQTDELRESYDTYEVIKRLSRQGFKSKIQNT